MRIWKWLGAKRSKAILASAAAAVTVFVYIAYKARRRRLGIEAKAWPRAEKSKGDAPEQGCAFQISITPALPSARADVDGQDDSNGGDKSGKRRDRSMSLQSDPGRGNRLRAPSVDSDAVQGSRLRAPSDLDKVEAPDGFEDSWLIQKSKSGEHLRRPLGISVRHLMKDVILDMKRKEICPDASVADIEPIIIRPKGENIIDEFDGELGASYAQCVHAEGGSAESTHMVSYTWRYKVKALASALSLFCEDKGYIPKETFTWLCCFSVNQHRVVAKLAKGKNVAFDEFHDTFKTQVVNIGRVIVLLSPWHDPEMLKRIWCIFEIYTALSLGSEKVKMDIVMPREEMRNFFDALIGPTTQGSTDGVDVVWKTCVAITMKDAQASVAADREHIMKLVEETVGTDAVDQAVAMHLQSWFVSAADHVLKDRLKTNSMFLDDVVVAVSRVAALWRRGSKLDRALAVLESGLDALKLDGMARTVECADLLRSIGETKKQLKDWQGSYDAYKQALDLRKETGSLESDDGAYLFTSLGILLSKNRAGDWAEDFTACLDTYGQAKDILERIGRLSTLRGALLLTNFGEALSRAGDPRFEAEFMAAKSIYESNGATESPDMAYLLHAMGRAHVLRGNLQPGFELFLEARQLRAKLGTLETMWGKFLQDDIRELEGGMKVCPA